MIKNNESISMAECQEFVKVKDDPETIAFIKKFTELSLKEGKEIREKILALNLIKIKNNHISKIIDLLPDTSADLNKIFEDVTLEEDETNKILNIVKEYK